MTTDKAPVLQRPWVGLSMMAALMLGLLQYWGLQEMIRQRLATIDAGLVDTLLWAGLIIGPFTFLLTALGIAVALVAVGRLLDEPWTFRELLAAGCLTELARLAASTVELWFEARAFARTGAVTGPAIADLNLLELTTRALLVPSMLCFVLVLGLLLWRALRWDAPSVIAAAITIAMLRALIAAVRMADPVFRS